jgi:hypothetical protein
MPSMSAAAPQDISASSFPLPLSIRLFSMIPSGAVGGAFSVVMLISSLGSVSLSSRSTAVTNNLNGVLLRSPLIL